MCVCCVNGVKQVHLDLLQETTFLEKQPSAACSIVIVVFFLFVFNFSDCYVDSIHKNIHPSECYCPADGDSGMSKMS